MSDLCLSSGDHVICGSYDCRLSWFDLDLSTKPYKMLRYEPVHQTLLLMLLLMMLIMMLVLLSADTIRRQ